jgi:inhibitor of nuclear factor kappa-B kinase subunit alpha
VHSEGVGGHQPSYIMVCWGVSHQGVAPLHFCEKSVKTGARVHQEDVLQGVVKPLNTAVFSGQKWVFQQDSAPAHKAKMTQEWLRRNVPAFISAEDWPLWSPNLNPLDYKLWAVLEYMACQKHHNVLGTELTARLCSCHRLP